MSDGTGNPRVSEEAVRQLLGNNCRSLSENDLRKIIQWLDPDTLTSDFFGLEETQVEYVLDRVEEVDIVLHLLKDGSWRRVRICPE